MPGLCPASVWLSYMAEMKIFWDAKQTLTALTSVGVLSARSPTVGPERACCHQRTTRRGQWAALGLLGSQIYNHKELILPTAMAKKKPKMRWKTGPAEWFPPGDTWRGGS